MERSKNEANRFLPGIPVSRSFDELLGDQSVQVIVVNTPDSSHYALANVIRIIEAAQKSDTEGRTVRLSCS